MRQPEGVGSGAFDLPEDFPEADPPLEEDDFSFFFFPPLDWSRSLVDGSVAEGSIAHFLLGWGARLVFL